MGYNIHMLNRTYKWFVTLENVVTRKTVTHFRTGQRKPVQVGGELSQRLVTWARSKETQAYRLVEYGYFREKQVSKTLQEGQVNPYSGACEV